MGARRALAETVGWDHESWAACHERQSGRGQGALVERVSGLSLVPLPLVLFFPGLLEPVIPLHRPIRPPFPTTSPPPASPTSTITTVTTAQPRARAAGAGPRPPPPAGPPNSLPKQGFIWSNVEIEVTDIVEKSKIVADLKCIDWNDHDDTAYEYSRPHPCQEWPELDPSNNIV